MEEISVKKIRIEIRKSLCKSCAICYTLCPKGALAGDEAGKAAVKDIALCSGCGLCEMRCPDYAVRVWRDIE